MPLLSVMVALSMSSHIDILFILAIIEVQNGEDFFASC